MSNLAVFVCEKVKTIRKGRAITRHNNRQQDVYNADPSREHLNIYSYKSAAFEVEFKKKIKETGANVAKNAVLAIEIVVSASHEAMKRIEADGKLDDWLKVNLDFIKREFGAENIMYWSLHRDELTVHLHAVVIPIVFREEGRFAGKFRLSATEFIGEPWKLSALQDRYADVVAPFGLKRGIVGTDASHEETEKWRAKNRKLDEIEVREDAVSKRELECLELDANLKSRETKIKSNEDEFSLKYSSARKGIESIAEQVKKHDADVKAREKLVEQNEKELINMREELLNLISTLDSRISQSIETGSDYADVEAELQEQKSKLNNMGGPGF